MTTCQTLIDELRAESLNDAAKDRYSDARLLGNLNEGLGETAIRRPDLFATQGTVATVAGVYQQAPAESIRLMDVMQVQNGRVVREVDQEVLDTLEPDWRTGSAGGTRNWMRYRKDPNRFMVSPPAPVTSQTLVVLYARTPAAVALADAFPLAEIYKSAIKHYILFKTESPQDESVLSGRALLMFQAFENSLAISVQSKQLVDDENSRRDQRG
jgi:hypothetical protein